MTFHYNKSQTAKFSIDIKGTTDQKPQTSDKDLTQIADVR